MWQTKEETILRFARNQGYRFVYILLHLPHVISLRQKGSSSSCSTIFYLKVYETCKYQTILHGSHRWNKWYTVYTIYKKYIYIRYMFIYIYIHYIYTMCIYNVYIKYTHISTYIYIYITKAHLPSWPWYALAVNYADFPGHLGQHRYGSRGPNSSPFALVIALWKT